MITDAQIEKGRESKKDKTDTETQTKKRDSQETYRENWKMTRDRIEQETYRETQTRQEKINKNTDRK